MLTDEQLVEASLNGTDAAFSELVTRYQQKLLRFLLTRAASRADAEDAIQDTFINAYRYLGSFDPRWRFSTWLYRIALRNLAKQARSGMQDSEVTLIADDDPLQQCIEQSAQENVWLSARKLLPVDSYTALWLRYVEDMSVREVSQALDKSESWTKVTLMRARRKLSAALRDADADSTRREIYG